jgi:transcriptional regulator with XRE-family HTH domain
MHQDFALELLLARRKSGLTQEDCGHLLGTDNTRISKFESGARQPTKAELLILCFILELPVDRLVQKVAKTQLPALRMRINTMPKCPRHWRGWKRRRETLHSLVEKLISLAEDDV